MTLDNYSKPRTFRPSTGFSAGQAQDVENTFLYCAALRVHGEGVPFVEIADRLGVQPTHQHRKGERPGPRSLDYAEDAWHYRPSPPETEPLAQHLDALWQVVRPAAEYLKSLKNRFRVDVFCGYRSNCEHSALTVPHTSLKLFSALEIPFAVSVIIV